MGKIVTDLKELDAHLRRLYMQRGTYEHKKGGRIDGKDVGLLSKQESDQARRTAEVFFEYNGTVYGLAGDTTFDAVKRFSKVLAQAGDNKTVFVETTTRTKVNSKSTTCCLHLGKLPNEPNGWYCYKADYFSNWSEQVTKKAA